MSKGKSLVPCPVGQVWNPESNVRRCVRKNMYKMLYGAEKAGQASALQKRLRGTKKNSLKPVVRSFETKKNAITPALKAVLPIEATEPRKDSVMSPGLLRDDMAKWVTKHCKNQEDPIMLEPYAEADLKDLRSLVRLGSGFCYTADVLDQHVRSSLERDVPIKDIMNPSYRLDARDFGALKSAAQVTKKSYTLPSEASEMPAKHYKLFIGVAGEPDFKIVFLFDERKVKKLAGGGQEYTNAIPDGGFIGWIPSKGTSRLEKLIRDAFERGRIFTKATRPFRCCRIHLKKDRAYWADGVTGKVKALEEELEGIL